MISKEKFRELIGPKAKNLSDKQIDVVCDCFYSLAYALLEWDKWRSEKDLKECADGKHKS